MTVFGQPNDPLTHHTVVSSSARINNRRNKRRVSWEGGKEMKRTTRTAKWLTNKRRIDDSRVCGGGKKAYQVENRNVWGFKEDKRRISNEEKETEWTNEDKWYKGCREAGDTVETFKYVDVKRRVMLERQEWELTEIEQCNGMCFIKESDRRMWMESESDIIL